MSQRSDIESAASSASPPSLDKSLKAVQEASLPSRGTPPVEDPLKVYPSVPGINAQLFQLTPEGLPWEQRAQALANLQQYESTQKAHILGYQVNQRFSFEADFKQYLDFHINNIGDPFGSGNFTVNTKWMERAVLDYYASLWHAVWPHDAKNPESYWGYVLTMGSSEGNLYGLWNARDYLAGKALMDDPEADARDQAASLEGRPVKVQRRLIYQQAPTPKQAPHAYTPVSFYSQDTHYSIIKAMRVLGIKTFYEVGTEQYPGQCPLGGDWPQEVPSQGGSAGPGSIDTEALVKLVEFFASRGYPILVSFNYGTTFKGAYDDVEGAGRKLMPLFKKYGLDERRVEYSTGRYDTRTGYWFHVDGALGAAYMPFIEMAYNAGLIHERGPNFDFRLPFVHSIAMSGHKWIGAPWPLGLYMTKTRMQLRPPDDPEYIGSPDTTFAGSRNGFSAMILWDYVARNSYQEQVAHALYTEELAGYAHERLLSLGKKLNQDLWVERAPLALTVRFKQAHPDLVFKYSLSGETLYVDGEQRAYSHIFLMNSVTRERIDAFIHDLEQPGAIPPQEKRGVTVPTHLAPEARRLTHVPHVGRGWR